MTPYDLRREADRKEREATARIADAARLRSQATGLRGLLRPLIGMSQRVWTGPAATDFESNIAAHDLALGFEADRLVAVAAGFEQMARELRAEATELRQRAAAAEIAAAAIAGAGPRGAA